MIIKATECIEVEFETKDKVCLNLQFEHLKDEICVHHENKER